MCFGSLEPLYVLTLSTSVPSLCPHHLRWRQSLWGTSVAPTVQEGHMKRKFVLLSVCPKILPIGPATGVSARVLTGPRNPINIGRTWLRMVQEVVKGCEGHSSVPAFTCLCRQQPFCRYSSDYNRSGRVSAPGMKVPRGLR